MQYKFTSVKAGIRSLKGIGEAPRAPKRAGEQTTAHDEDQSANEAQQEFLRYLQEEANKKQTE